MKVTLVLPFLALHCLARAEQQLQHRASNWTVGQTVQTGSGPVNGHAGTVASEVSVYLGIPYAAPPVGDLRFSAPQKYSGTSTVNGTSYGFSCLTNTVTATGGSSNIANANLTVAGVTILEALGQFGDKFSEDCLTLNVWTKPQTGDAKKAVLFWIYGGGFTTGNSDNPAYDGQFIADQEDVILVSANYRLNIYGFPGSPNTTNNLGLLDQRLAVEWVRDNIAAFGGDPDRITLFGQSAGGASVDFYSFAWTSDPIVAGFIPESGTTGLGGSQNTAAASAAVWFQVTSNLGCGNASSDGAAVLSCMRSKNSSAILGGLSSSGLIGGTGFGPTIDETVVFSDYLNRSAAGNFIKRPLLVGNTNYEAGLFRAVAAVDGLSANYSDAYWDSFNLGFDCPATARANVSVTNGVPTWRYRWFGEFPNTIITTVPDSGAYHASELPLIFNTTPSGSGIPNDTAAEIAIGAYLRGAWATFAKDPVNGLRTYIGGNGTGWPTYLPGQNTLIRLAYQNQTGPNLALSSLYDAGCNETFAVPASVLGNTTTGGTSTTSGTASGTGSGAASTVTKSAGGRVAVGVWVAGAAIAMAAALL